MTIQRDSSPVAVAAGLAVRCSGIVKTYGQGGSKVTALRGIDLEIRRAELMMLVGPSGCGKTTLISVIAGILDQDDGECRVYRQDLNASCRSGSGRGSAGRRSGSSSRRSTCCRR